MKKTLGLLLFLALGLTLSAQNTPANTKLLVYYFHLTNRCPTCLKIESVTQKVLQENYKQELDSGIIVFKSFNVELPENKAISEKYEAYGATLALTQISGGKEKIEDLTNFAFSKIHTEEAFILGLKTRINLLLK